MKTWHYIVGGGILAWIFWPRPSLAEQRAKMPSEPEFWNARSHAGEIWVLKSEAALYAPTGQPPIAIIPAGQSVMIDGGTDENGNVHVKYIVPGGGIVPDAEWRGVINPVSIGNMA